VCTHNSRDPLPKVVIVVMALFEAMYPNQMQISRALALNRRADRDTLSLKGRLPYCSYSETRTLSSGAFGLLNALGC
jgi:hypothetical protein